MKKSMNSLFLLSLTATTLAYGWGGQNGNPQMAPEGPTAGGVDNPSVHLRAAGENGYLKLSYLLFRPNLDDTSFTTKVVNAFGTTPSSNKVSPKSPDFDWSSGVRLNIGRYLPNHDQWDVGFAFTFLYSDATRELSVPSVPTTIPGTYLTPQLFQGVLGDYATEASGHWRMNFFTYDLGLSREYFLTPKVTAKPYIGARGLAIYQSYLAKYDGVFINTVNSTLVGAGTRYAQSQTMWGVGLKVATDLAFQLPAHFSLFGNLGGSLLYGHFNSRQRVQGGLAHPNLTPYNPTVQQHGYDLQTGLEGSLGIQWQHWYPKNNNCITASFAFEAQQWFDMNKWSRTSTTTLTPAAPVGGQTSISIPGPDQEHGDLTFMGFAFALQWDF